MGIETIIGGAIGLIGASESADAVEDAAAQQAAVQKYIFDTTVQMQQPFLNTGYAANNELAALYGLAPPITSPTAAPSAYTGVPASGDIYTSPGAAAQQPVGGPVGAPVGYNPYQPSQQSTPMPFDPASLASNAPLYADADRMPGTGEIYINDQGWVYDPYTDYETMREQYVSSLPGEPTIQEITGDPTYQQYASLAEWQGGFNTGLPPGYTTPPPTTGGTGGGAGDPVTMTSAEQQQAAIERFYNSPEYQLMYQPAVQYGTEHLNQIAAAGGSFQSGAQAQALAGYAGDLASQTYGNYVNQLNSMAGYGQTAAGNIQTAGANYATGMGNAYMNAGNAQATGIAGMTNAALGGINAYMNYGGGYGGTNMVNTSMPYSTVPTGPGYAAGNGTIYLGSW